MSRAINTSLATIQFQVNARQANAAMLALQEASDDLNRAIDSLNRNIANLGKDVPKDNPQLLNYQNQLKSLQKDLKDVEKAQRDFMKGAKAADQLWQAATNGNIESLSFRSIKAGINGLKKRQEGLIPGDAQDMKDWRIIKEVIDEADRVMKQAGADVQNVVQTIREGGKVSEQTMRQTISTLKELKGSVDETDAEYRTYGNDLDFMEAKLQEFSDARRRARGEIVDANDARREMNKLTEEGAAAAKREAEEAEQLVASLKQESEELVRKRGEIKQNIEDTQKQIDENHKLIEEKHRQLAADEETFNAEQQSRRESIDGLKQQAEAERKLANEKSDAAETHRRMLDLQAQNGASQETQNEGERKYIELLGEATEANNRAVAAETKLADAQSEATQKQVEFNQKQQEGLDNINQMAQGNQALQESINGLNGELEQNSKDIADNANKTTEAEQKKQQAQQLTIKRMEEMLATLRKENNEVIPANTEKWRENEAEINRLSGALEKMKETARIDLIKTQGQEALSFFEKDTAGRSQADTASASETAEKVKALAAYRDVLPKDTDVAVFARIDEILKEQAKLLKETTGEWMSYEDAKELASKAGGEGFLATTQQMQQAVQAMERQRDALIKTIQLKQKDGKATADEEAQLDKLEKELKDLKFEQDNFNMSHKHMQDLLNEPNKAENLDELKAAIKRADGELHRMKQSLGENSKEYQEFADQTKNAKNVLKEMEGQAKATSTAWEKAWSRLKTYVGMYMGFNMAWQKVTGTADDLLELSDKMGEVRKTTGFTADEVGRLSDNLAKLDTRTSLTGLMEFSSLAGSIGMKTQEQVQGFTEAANMLAVSLPEMGNEASRTLMKIADATGDLEKNGGNVRETLERVGSTIIALRANSAAAAGPITDFVSRVGAVGAQAGISIDQIAALGATVDALGGRVEMSATALSRMIPAIRNNTFEVAKAIGMTEKELKGMTGMEQMVAIFRKLHDSVKQFDMTTEDGMNSAADAVENMLGRSVSMQDVMKQLNQQGARAGIVFGLLSQNVDKLEEQLDTASEAYSKNVALMNEYSKMNDTTAAKLERLKNEIEEWFVSDTMQRWLGRLIDSLRALADWFSSDGVLATGFKMMLAYVLALKSGFGSFFTGVGQGFGVIRTAILSGVNVIATAAGSAVNSLTGMTNAMRGVRAATIGARREWVKMDAAMKANIIGAVITALGWLALKLWDVHKAAKEAAAETGRFNQQMADEKKALNGLFDPLNKSNMAQEERSKLIKEINSQYGRYLGYMLSEYSSAIQLADAHALIAKRIREEAYERRLAEQEKKIYEKHDEDVNAAYGGIESAVRGGAKNDADVQTIADMMKSFVDKNMDAIVESGKTLPKGFVEKIDGMTERLVQDGKLTREGASEARTAMFKYLDEAKQQAVELKNATAGIRSDLRGIQGAIKVDLANNLNTLISNVANSVSNAVRQVQNKQQPQQSPYLQRPGSGIPSLFGGGQQGGTLWQAPWQQGSRETTPDQQMAPAGWKPNINKKDVNAVRQFVQDQEALRGALEAGGQQIDEAQRRVAESWLLTDKELKEYKAIVEKADRGPGGGNNNPYGDYNKVTSPYSQWNGDDLVARRKEMLERVRALANGADVQKVLSEDARFISDAVRKNIKTTEQAIEWYNSERLKIQDALHAKHLTNTGDWLDPKKGAKRASRVVNDEMKYYLDELDAYYTERKAKIEEARNDEQITEAEAWRRTIKNDTEWQQRRAELQQMYSKRRGEVAKESAEYIYNIISERTGESTDFIRKDIAQTYKFILAVGDKSKAAMDRIFGDIDLGVEKSFLKSAQAIGKQMKFIEDTLAKERPYDGITKNLQENLDKMGVLAAQYKRINDELAKQGKEAKYSNEEITAQTYKEMAFYLKQAEDAWSIDIDELLRRMAEEGMVTTAEEISKSELLKQAVMGQLRKTFEEVQNAVKKEASQIKKDVDIIWNDDTRGPGGMSMKAAYDKAIARLGMQQDSVSRANSLIGAGPASDNVAARLAMKQIEVQMRMQKAQFDMYRVQANQRMEALNKEAAEHRRIAAQMKKEGQNAEAELELLKAANAERDAANVKKSLGLTLAEETKKEEESISNLLKLQEESQNRLYTSLREWSDLLTSGLQSVMEASHAGDAEYYNERAKMNLTGKGGPGAGTYIIIDNEGTEDAVAHYEYLDERQALERQHEIERENAQAEAWKKLWDDLNMKMSDQITDWINASMQNASIDANTDATRLNTDALGTLTEKLSEGITVNTDSGMPLTDLSATYGSGEGGSVEGMVDQLQDLSDFKNDWYTSDAYAKMAADDAYTEHAVENSKKRASATSSETKSETSSTQSSFSKMAAAANMYGLAYQTMSNDNLDAFQKFQMFALQAAGQTAIAMLTTDMAKTEADGSVKLPGILGEAASQLGPIAGPIAFAAMTALLGGLMAMAMSKVGKAKSTISQVTGASVSAGRLSTGMLTYAEGNVNEFTDPRSLTPGRSYNVDAADGRTYRAKYTGTNPRTHLTNGPEFHLSGEKGREMIIDAGTTRQITMNENEIWRTIQTLSGGGRVRRSGSRMGRGIPAFADGNLEDFEALDSNGMTGGAMDLTAIQGSLDRNSAVQEALLERLNQPIYAQNILYGPDGLPNVIANLQKEAAKHGEKYI